MKFENSSKIQYSSKTDETNFVGTPSYRTTSFMQSNLLNSCSSSVQNSENENKDKFISPYRCMLTSQNLACKLFMSFLKSSPSGIFKPFLFYQLFPFIALQCWNFIYLFLHDLGLNFGYVTPHNISRVQKIVIIFVLPEQSEIINSISNPYQIKVKYINTLYQNKYMYILLAPAAT
jgi:hypothetical protein